MKTLPKEIWVADAEGSWPLDLRVVDGPKSVATIGDKRLVGRYELRETVQVEGEPKITRLPATRA